MIYQDHAVLGFHFAADNTGNIRVHLRAKAEFDIPLKDAFVCDFLTGENVVPSQEYFKATPLALLHESRHLHALMRYVNILTKISDLIVAHGHNTEVFGLSAGQELIIDFSKTYRVALRIENSRMLSALSTAIAGIEANGDILTSGTVISFDRFLTYLLEQVETAIKSIADERQANVRKQWDIATRSIVERCKKHFIHGAPDAGELLNAHQACEYLKVSKTTLARYRDGSVPSGYSPFPAPDDYHGRSPLWKLISLLVWKNSRMQ